MSEWLVYFSDEKYFSAYRSFSLSFVALDRVNSLYNKSISTEHYKQEERERKEGDRLLILSTRQTRDREERARKMAETQNLSLGKLRTEARSEEESQDNSILQNQRKFEEEKRRKRENELLEEKRKLKELQEKLERQKAEQRELERRKKQEEFSGKEEKLLESIEETEAVINDLKARIERNTNQYETTSRETLRLLGALEENQRFILQKEQESREWQSRYEASERLRKETEKAYQREAMERAREEAEMKLAELEAAIRIVDGDLIKKWKQKEFSKLLERIEAIKKDLEKSNFKTAMISLSQMYKELETVKQEACADEKSECQREHVAGCFLEALRYLGYEAEMRQNDPNDLRSSVVIQGKMPSRKGIEITLPLGEVYNIKFSGMEEKKCCSEEMALREIMAQAGIQSRALEPVNPSSGMPAGKPGMKLEFRDGNKRIELRQQFCG
jgi:DNA repair exonuclease SbcCD ATPase subunit